MNNSVIFGANVIAMIDEKFDNEISVGWWNIDGPHDVANVPLVM